MFYRELASVANHLNNTSPGIDEILQMFCMQELAHLRFIGAIFFTLERDGFLHTHDFYGIQPAEIGIDQASIGIYSEVPWARCIREDSLVWTEATSAKRLRNARVHSYIAWPVKSDFRVIGSMLVLSESQAQPDGDLREFINAFAAIVSGTLINQVIKPRINTNILESKSDPHKATSESLSERQELILKLITEGRTNRDIADILGYSESLIRQETIKIYAVLGCSGRSEAARYYQLRNSINQESEPEATITNASR